jgi:mitochondrial fission protein ELM1
MIDPDTCWAISDGAAGNERQACALAEALGFSPRVLRLRVAQPWDLLAPRLVAGARGAIRDSDGRALQPPWPAIAIGCGRRAALATRGLRAWSDGGCYAVQVLDPRVDTRAWDLVVAPQHDGVDAANVLRSIGALNPVDAGWLAAGRRAFAALDDLPVPRTALLVGASTRAQRLDDAYFDALLARLAPHGGGSFLVSVSRRTDPATTTRLRAAFAPYPGVFWASPADGPNPYAGILAWADRIVVTPDSVNMLSEACATGRPVFTFAPRPIRGKLARFHAELHASGHVRALGEAPAQPQPPPLAETAAIAELVRERWNAARAARAQVWPSRGSS